MERTLLLRAFPLRFLEAPLLYLERLFSSFRLFVFFPLPHFVVRQLFGSFLFSAKSIRNKEAVSVVLAFFSLSPPWECITSVIEKRFEM